MKKASVAAGIVNEDNMRLSFDNLMRDIILDIFVWLPISVRKLSRYIVITHDLLEDFFINETLEHSSMYISESLLKAKASEEVDKFINEKKLNLLHAIYYQISDKISLSPINKIKHATQNNLVE